MQRVCLKASFITFCAALLKMRLAAKENEIHMSKYKAIKKGLVYNFIG
jgi:hypothetical protein